jgi:TatD DNase family protein
MADTQQLVLIDTHAHLDASDYAQDRAAVIARAYGERIGVISVGADLSSSRQALGLAARHRALWPAVGVHPHDAKTLDPQALKALERLAGDGAVAIGEIGLDYYRDLSPHSAQRQAFADQLDLARSLDLPVIIHNRESTKDLVAILRKHPPRRGVVHSFLGDRALAETFLALGLHLGIGGPLTFKRNEPLREAVKTAPLDRLLVETDCPYLTPVPHRGKRNEPAYVRYVAEAIAALRGESFLEIAAVTTRNASALFSLASD